MIFFVSYFVWWFISVVVVFVGNYNLLFFDVIEFDVVIIGGGDIGVDCIGIFFR